MNGFIDKKEIAFDFDGVVADTMGLFVDLVRSDFGRDDISLEDITDYDLTKCLDISIDILIDIGSKIMSENCADYLKPMEGAVNVLNSFTQDSSPLLIITARPEKKPVENWLNTYLNIGEENFKVIATGDFNAKAEVLKQYEKKYLIEDRIETCFYLKETGFEPVVFIQPWNRKPNNFIEVQSWADIAGIMAG